MNTTWTISFLFWSITFCQGSRADNPIPDGYIEHADLDQALRELTLRHHNVWVYVPSLYQVARFFLSRHKYVKAAGGVVCDPAGRTLLIHREGNWDLPKGMIERGERPIEAAEREVREETGISHLSIDRSLINTYHIYDKYGGWHIKKTYWYAMSSSNPSCLKPQTEEGISECRWCSPDERRSHFSTSFAMMNLIEKAL